MKIKTLLSITLVASVSFIHVGIAKATVTSETSTTATTTATTSTTTATKTKSPASAKTTVNTTEASESPEATKTTKSTATTTKKVEKTEVETEKEVEDSYSEYKAAKSADKLAKAQAVGIKLIDKRINTLTNFSNKQFKGLTTAQLVAIKTQVTTYTDALTVLKIKIQADTTVDQVKADIKTVYGDFNVYQSLMPLLHLTNALNQSQAILDKLNALTVRLTATVTAQKSAGKDTTVLATAFADYKAQIVDATTQLASAKTEVAKIDIKNVDTSKTAITAALDSLTKFKADAVAAKGDLTTFKTILLSLSSASSTSISTTATTSATRTSAITE